MERFSLLLLEPHEIYFEDFAVVLHPDPEVLANLRLQEKKEKAEAASRANRTYTGIKFTC